MSTYMFVENTINYITLLKSIHQPNPCYISYWQILRLASLLGRSMYCLQNYCSILLTWFTKFNMASMFYILYIPTTSTLTLLVLIYLRHDDFHIRYYYNIHGLLCKYGVHITKVLVCLCISSLLLSCLHVIMFS